MKNSTFGLILGLGMLFGSFITTSFFHFSKEEKKESFALKLHHCYVDNSDKVIFKVSQIGEYSYKLLEQRGIFSILARNIKHPEAIQELDCNFVKWKEVKK